LSGNRVEVEILNYGEDDVLIAMPSEGIRYSITGLTQGGEVQYERRTRPTELVFYDLKYLKSAKRSQIPEYSRYRQAIVLPQELKSLRTMEIDIVVLGIARIGKINDGDGFRAEFFRSWKVLGVDLQIEKGAE
jgi:hypothetical protein